MGKIHETDIGEPIGWPCGADPRTGENLYLGCGEALEGEIAEVVRDDKHVVVHVMCMSPGEEIA